MLGLSFAIAPRHIPLEEIISATEAMARRLDHKSADTLRLGVSAALRKAKPPKANLSTQQRKALHTLQDDPNIVIVPADKGKATVVMDKADYTRRMMLTLEDEKYSPLRRDQTVKVENKFASILKRLCREGHIDEKLCDLLTPRYSSAPQMYGLPKVHKDGTPMRPIVSAIGSPSYKLAKELARILTPLTGNTMHAVKNSTSFVDRIHEIEMGPQDRMISFDVTNLFTQVPVDEALRVVEERLSADDSLKERTSIPTPQLIELIELCVRSTYFQFQDKFFEQTDGAAMGSPLSPVLANLYMEHLEENALRTAPLPPRLWLRYVDDTFVIWSHGQDELQRFHEHLNGQHPNIKFTIEHEKENKLAFLDVHVTRSETRLCTGVYRKPTHTDRYIPFHSHHHQRTITGVLRCMCNRAHQICDSTSEKPELQHLQRVFQANGFPEDLVKKTLSRRPTFLTPPPSEPASEDPPKTMCLPYIQGLSEKLERVCTSLGVKAVFKPVRTLRQILMQVKTRIPEERKRGVVYEVPCKECHQTYIGETKRTLKVRLSEHKQAVKRGDPKNGIAVHAHESSHMIDWDGARVRRSGMIGYWQRRTTEAIHIKLSKKTMNLDGGLQLSTVWNPVLNPP